MKHPFISWNSLFAKFLSYTCVIILVGCSQGSKKPLETSTSGTIRISVDESFKPIIDSQISVFVASHPDANIIAEYKPEAECLRDLAKDSTRMIIVTRGLSPEEEIFYKDSLTYVPRFERIAYDAVAVIVNNKSKDSVFTMDDVAEILKGTSKYKLRPVMDGTSATSTVRFALDSIINKTNMGKQKMAGFGSGVTAARSSEAVIDYVSNNEDAIGFIGVSWIGNREDPQQVSFLEKVKIASVQCVSCSNETYVKPYQANIATGRYPMVRSLYYIVKENFSGLGSGFANFLQYERGQKIFLRAYLWPAKMSFEVREVQM
ncbi:MAG TPA: substrate-binding domain-containing protein [Chitinophagaceae bacterium]|nr:substrate-binding domain-containing protein [Chitinophagaceae bacterium]